MTDSPLTAPSQDVRRRMSRQRRRDTTPEVSLRCELHARGLRYRVDAPLPMVPRRRADVLFTRARVAVFIDGCFWHSCPEHGVAPSNNAEWWAEKLARNVARDRDTDARLRTDGWRCLRAWEHDVRADVQAVADQVERLVRVPQEAPS